MRYMDLHKPEFSPEPVEEPREFFESLPVTADFASPRTMSLPGLEGLFFVVLTTAALVTGMLVISLITSRDLSVSGGGVQALPLEATISSPATLQDAATVGAAQDTDAARSAQSTATLQSTGDPAAGGVSTGPLQGPVPATDLRY